MRLDAGSLAVCHLCYQGATDAETAACEVEVDPGGLEAALLRELESSGIAGETTVAFALTEGL